MRIKAVLFDLDDTLFDQTNQITPKALAYVAQRLVEAGLPSTIQHTLKLLTEGTTPHFSVMLNHTLEHFNLSPDEFTHLTDTGRKAYLHESHLEGVLPYPETIDVLKRLHETHQLILITTGTAEFQGKKIDAMGLREYFDLIICDENPDKESKILYALRTLGLKPREVLSVGDRIDNEIRASNKIGLITARLLRGKYCALHPKHHDEHPDYEIHSLLEIEHVLHAADNEETYLKKGPRIVAIGGGTGLPFVLGGLKHYTHNLTAIVTVTDSGRSSGVLRKELGMPPPGDIRNNLIALSDAEDLLLKLFQYRFTEGQLEGHTLGNLFLAGLTKVTGSFEEAIVQASRILNVRGKVIPSTLEDVHVHVQRADGTIAHSEDEVVQRNAHTTHTSPITHISLEPKNPQGYPPAIHAIEEANYIIIGPGSLYTSIITNLLIPDIADAIRRSHATKVYVCNIVTQPFQTDGYTAADHLLALHNVLQSPIDYCLLNNKSPDLHLLHQYEQEHQHLVKVDLERIESAGAHAVLADLLPDTSEAFPANGAEARAKPEHFYYKRNLLRHDPHKLAASIIELADSCYCEKHHKKQDAVHTT